MCDYCGKLGLFEGGHGKEYMHAVEELRQGIAQGWLKFLEGDCPVEDILEELHKEQKYIMRHFFRCRHCRERFYLGVCVRGSSFLRIHRLADG